MRLPSPKISIVMPHYNDLEGLCRATLAVHKQTYTNWHLYVVDDGSDDLVDVRGPKTTAIAQPNRGVCAARNTALSLIRDDDSELVAYCDADDWWDTDYLEQQVAAIVNCDMVYGTVRLQWFNGQVAHAYGIPDYSEYPGLDALKQGNFIHISGVMHRKECLSVGQFNPALNSIEDWDYWTRIAEAGYSIRKSPAQFTYTVKFDGNASRSNNEVYERYYQLHATI